MAKDITNSTLCKETIKPNDNIKLIAKDIVKYSNARDKGALHLASAVYGNCEYFISIPEDMKDIIDILEPLNIEARYPSQKDKLFAELTEMRCNKILSDTEVLYRWIIDKFMEK